MLNVNKTDLLRHHEPETLSDRFAASAERLLTAIAGGFGRRYGSRVVVLETIAAVPAMVSASLLHLQCLRQLIDDRGWVRTFMDEAENQRAHLMAFVAIQRPSWGERWLIAIGQGIFYNAYFLLSLISSRSAHRLAGYLAERSVRDYSDYLALLQSGQETNGPAPETAVAYWNLAPDARLSDMIIAMREDEAIHRDIHHAFADALAQRRVMPDRPAPLI